MKTYTAPEIEVFSFDVEDIMTVSGGGYMPGEDEGPLVPMP